MNTINAHNTSDTPNTPTTTITDLPFIQYPDLANARILVTGSSQGIGHALCHALCKQGADVIGIDSADSNIADTTQISPGTYQHYTCDLADAEALQSCMHEICRSPLDGIVNVAGIDPIIPLAEADLLQWQRVIDLDLRAYHLIIHHGLAAIQNGTLKSIVNMSSINHQLGVPGRGLYTIAKCGIIGLTRGLARELGQDGIRLNTISPGWVFTERQIAEYFTNDSAGVARQEDLFTNKQSLRMQIHAEDIAAHCLFYLSRISRSSTGHNCIVDAGWTLE